MTVVSCSSMRNGKKVGITAGAFDLCHAGHMLVFKEAKTVCDYLIVALQDDPSDTPPDYRGKKKNKPVMSLEMPRIVPPASSTAHVIPKPLSLAMFHLSHR